ncbi:MAG: SulP family inorganic anion transporter [Saprospiraceae bacterium]|nr:SulP family inorganic anion transporter [Saprospiraceae bacterium]MDW8228555.1 SulP family inorganic anion transporter [Saprospiraceae bacterium]
MNIFKRYVPHLRYDLPASIVVFLVALPLCLGIALASGAPLFAGMIAGIVGGIVIGLLSNSHTSVSGPAAGLTAVVLVSIQQLGSYEVFLLAVVLAGAMQLALGLLKAGGIADFIPSSVIRGMLTGIGIIIILKQLPHALGYDREVEGSESFWGPSGETIFSILWSALMQYIHPGAALVAGLSLAILIAAERPAVKRCLGVIPGALVAVLFSIFVNEVFKFFNASEWVIQKDHLVSIPVANSLSEFFSIFTLPDFSAWSNTHVYTVALTLCAIASVETLLCIEAMDREDPLKRTTDPNIELRAQGIGNMLSGLVGGLPMTSVIVRSSANLAAGARTKASTILHGFFLLLTVITIPNALNLIPLSSLAAILLTVGYKLAKPSIFKEVWKNGKYQWRPFIVTVVAIVLTDLLTGVLIGLAISTFYLLYANMKNAYFFHSEEYHEGDLIRIRLSQEVSFLNKASIKRTLDQLPEGSQVLIDASDTAYIDFDVLEIIRDFAAVKAQSKNIRLALRGFHERYDIGDADFVHCEQLSPQDPLRALFAQQPGGQTLAMGQTAPDSGAV